MHQLSCSNRLGALLSFGKHEVRVLSLNLSEMCRAYVFCILFGVGLEMCRWLVTVAQMTCSVVVTELRVEASSRKSRLSQWNDHVFCQRTRQISGMRMNCARFLLARSENRARYSSALSICCFRKREWSGKRTRPPPPPLWSLPAGASPPRPSQTPNRPKSSHGGRAAAGPSNHQRKTLRTERSPSMRGRRANCLSTSSTVTAFSRRCFPRSMRPTHGPFTSPWMQRPWNYMTITILSNTPWISVLLKYVHAYHLSCRMSQPSGCRGLAPSGGEGRDKGGKWKPFGCYLDIFIFCFLTLSFFFFSHNLGCVFFCPTKHTVWHPLLFVNSPAVYTCVIGIMLHSEEEVLYFIGFNW